MIYDDLQRLVGYGLSIIEFYNENNELEYIANLDDLEFEDVDIILSENHKPLGIIKLYRNDKESQYDDKSV